MTLIVLKEARSIKHNESQNNGVAISKGDFALQQAPRQCWLKYHFVYSLDLNLSQQFSICCKLLNSLTLLNNTPLFLILNFTRKSFNCLNK